MLKEDVNLIVDDNFLNKDVSELIVEYYYLFDVQDTSNGVKLYFYKDGIVFVSAYTDSDEVSIINKFEYTSGSLQELVEVKLNNDWIFIVWCYSFVSNVYANWFVWMVVYDVKTQLLTMLFSTVNCT